MSVRWILLIQHVDRRIHSPVYGTLRILFGDLPRPKAGMTEDSGRGPAGPRVSAAGLTTAPAGTSGDILPRVASPEVARLTRRLDEQDDTVRAVSDTLLEIKETVDHHTEALAAIQATQAQQGETLSQHGEMLGQHGGMLGQQGGMLGQQGEMLGQQGEMLSQQGEMLGQHGEMLSQQGETLSQHGEMLSQHGEMLAEILRRLGDGRS